MPVYECLCLACHRHSSILFLRLRSPAQVSCRHCGGSHVDRLFSRYAAPKSEEAWFEAVTDLDTLEGPDENDPRSVARLMKKMGDEVGEEVGDDVEAIMMGQIEEERGTMEGNDSE